MIGWTNTRPLTATTPRRRPRPTRSPTARNGGRCTRLRTSAATFRPPPSAAEERDAAVRKRFEGLADDDRDVVAHAGKAVLALGALGVVYGDIGTSPLYTEQVIFTHSQAAATPPWPGSTASSR